MKPTYDIQNYDIALGDDYIVGNLRLKWTSSNDAMTVSAFVNNIADEEYLTYTFDFTGPGGFNQLHYGKPRWFGGSVRYSLAIIALHGPPSIRQRNKGWKYYRPRLEEGHSLRNTGCGATGVFFYTDLDRLPVMIHQLETPYDD